MKKVLRKISCAILSAAMLTMIPTLYPAIAADDNISLSGNYYEMDNGSDYRFDNDTPMGNTDKFSTLGELSISGNIKAIESNKKMPVFEVSDNEVFSLKYKYTDDLLNESKENWHLVSESNKEINNTELDNEIGNGAVILQTSIDGTKWVTADVETDFVHSSGTVSFDASNGINDIQLMNGCYYRIIVAYKKEMKIGTDFISFWKINRNDVRECAEVYKFYASYKETENFVTGNANKYFEVGNSTYTSLSSSNDFQGGKVIGSDDPQIGWTLGKFVLSGYTSKTDDSDVYLKTVDDKIRLSFRIGRVDTIIMRRFLSRISTQTRR